MKFRTEIETRPNPAFEIRHGEGIVMLGSCFTDNIGTLLKRDGFDVTHNPLGSLYNPASIANAMSYALTERTYTAADFAVDDAGVYHCLDFYSKYKSADPAMLAEALNAELSALRRSLLNAHTVIITLGTAYAYRWLESGQIVGNCHKFPQTKFSRSMLSESECAGFIRNILSLLPIDAKAIFTISPIRHIGDGLHGNQLSKSTLQLAVDDAMQDCKHACYFPAYEIMIDDLRDYRFYAADMVHPSEVAIEYIYQQFANTFFSKGTIQSAADHRQAWKRSMHRPLPTI